MARRVLYVSIHRTSTRYHEAMKKIHAAPGISVILTTATVYAATLAEQLLRIDGVRHTPPEQAHGEQAPSCPPPTSELPRETA